jgi:hypothetical protein
MIPFDAIRLSGLTDIDLPILGASLSEPFQVTAVDGLGPPELEVILAETHAPGGIFVSRRAQGREIVVRVSLNPNYKTNQSISDLRYLLYGLLSPGTNPADQSVYVRFMQDNVPVVQTQGYVKLIEIVPFDKKPQAQITITCLGPYLTKPEIVDLSNIPNDQTWTLVNQGLAPTGIEFAVTFDKAISTFSINITNSGQMSFSGDFLVGDKLIVDTNEATRFVGQLRGTEYVEYLELMSAQSSWLTLMGGEHVIETSNVEEFTWDYFRYYERYWGI